MTDAHRRMAMIPKGAKLIETLEGRPPQLQFKNIFIFPGIPEFLKSRFYKFLLASGQTLHL